MPGPQPVLPSSQGYPTGTYPTSGTWGYPVTPASPASSGRPMPAVTSISPTGKAVNTGPFDLIVKGSGFTADCVITIATVAQPTQILDDRTLVSPQTSQGKVASTPAVTVANGTQIATPGQTFTYT